MSTFTPVAGLVGGLLIGTSAVLLFAVCGRLAGISNMAHGIVDAVRQRQASAEWMWRLCFIAGMIAGAWAYFALTRATVNPRTGYSPVLLVLGGLLVGYGTARGNGCTSGHGVCGLGRLSPRSLIATLTFMAAGVLTVFVVRHLAHL